MAEEGGRRVRGNKGSPSHDQSPSEAPMSDWKKDALKATSTRKELGNVRMKELGMLEQLEKPCVYSPAYPSLGFLSEQQVQVVASLPTDMKRMNKVIDYLVDKEDKYFEYFCKMLEWNSYDLLSNRLRKKAEEFKSAFDAQQAANISALPRAGGDSNVLQMSSSPKSPTVPDQPPDSPIATPVPKRRKVGNGSSSPKTPSVPDQPPDPPIGTPVPKQKKLENYSASLKSPKFPDHPSVSPTASSIAERKKMATVFDGDEVLMQQLCYMATEIKQLLITPAGGTFTLGSDASLKFPPGAVAKETSIHCVIILCGPFVFPTGYQLASVVVYINMDGVVLMKPAELLLAHWCIKEEGDDEDVLKFVRAPHTLGKGQKCYEFEEQEEADFTTHDNVGNLKIAEPQCLHCVAAKTEMIARYRAVTFTQYLPSENTLLFRIQLMCDSPEWNESLTHALQQDYWQKTKGIDELFEYSSTKKPITASPLELEGPGWVAKIEGKRLVDFNNSLLPKASSKSEIEEAISSGSSPPCFLYKVFCGVCVGQQAKPPVVTVALHGEDLELRFNCRILDDMFVRSPAVAVDTSAHSPYSPQADTAPSVARPLSSPQAEISHPADVLIALDHQLDAQWRKFGTFLYVNSAVMDGISKDTSDVDDCMLRLVEKWLAQEDGTGNLPRTWQTVVQAVKHTGKRQLAEQLAEQYGVQLTSQ